MRWLFFVFSAVCFLIAFRTYSVGLAALCLLLALGLLLAGVLAMASHRVQARARDEIHIVSPEELRRLREQAGQPRATAPGMTPMPPASAGDDDAQAPPLPPRAG